jgi:hypothetical protein
LATCDCHASGSRRTIDDAYITYRYAHIITGTVTHNLGEAVLA